MSRDLFGPIGPIMDDYEKWYLQPDEWPSDDESEDHMELSAIIEGFVDVLDRLDDLRQAADDLELVTGIRMLNVPEELHILDIDGFNILAREFDKPVTVTPMLAPAFGLKVKHSITVNCIKVYCYA